MKEDEKKKSFIVSSLFFFIFLFNLDGTVIGARVYFSGLVFDPRVNLDEFGDEARYVTLDNCGVPPKDVFVHHVHCIPLPDNCNQTPVSGFTISRTSTYTLVSVIHRSIVAIAGSRIRATLNGVAFQSSDRSRALSTALLLPLPRPTYSIAKPILSDPSFFPLRIHRTNRRTNATTKERILANLFLRPCSRSIPYDCPSAT